MLHAKPPMLQKRTKKKQKRTKNLYIHCIVMVCTKVQKTQKSDVHATYYKYSNLMGLIFLRNITV